MEKDNELFDLMSRMYSDMQDGFKSMYSDMQDGFKSVNKRIDTLDTKVSNLEVKVDNLDTKVSNLEVKVDNLDKVVKKTNLVIENDIKPKITALFDGYSLTSNKIENIKNQVSKHDNFIIKRIK